MALTKEKYIKKYGEEAWKEHAAKKAEYLKRYRLEHKNEIKEKYKEYKREYQRKYRIENRDKCLETLKKSRAKYRNKRNEEKRKYYYANKEMLLAKQKEYSDTHREERKEYCKQYFSSKTGRAKNILTQYRRRDISAERGECTITEDYIINSIFTSKCVYCGDSNWKHLGCDRIDNNIPHTPDNVICACGVCNSERQCRKMTVEEFVEYRKTHPRDSEQPLEIVEEIVRPNGTKFKAIKKNTLLSA